MSLSASHIKSRPATMIGTLFLFHTTTFLFLSHILPALHPILSHPVHPHPMAHITTALLGSFTRLFSPSSPAASALGLSHSKSDPDLVQRGDAYPRPASSTGVRPRPASAMSIEGPYWGWDAGAEGTTLRRRTRTERDVGLKITHSSNSPVLASRCQPPHPAWARTPLPISDAHADTAAAADVVNAPAPTPVPTSTLDRRADFEPETSTLRPAYTLDYRGDSEFDISLDISLINDTSASSDDESNGDCDISGLFMHDCRGDSSFDTSLDISLISDSSTSSESDGDVSFSSFTLQAPPLGLGLGITGLYKPSGAPFDGTGVLSFGVRDSHSFSGSPCNVSASPSHSSSRCHSPPTPRFHAQTQSYGLSRTFLEELEATWAADPHHLGLGDIDEEPYVLDCAGEVVDICGDTDTSGRKSRTHLVLTRTHEHGVERDTISSGLKRKPASGVPRQGARPHRVWRA
ncbi:hypothetical protein DFH06DRAFT_1252281 [Mycena polygramma]|nr:hypothetical protein DFH06DRAFT_1252281 [Mycena polygramma]